MAALLEALSSSARGDEEMTVLAEALGSTVDAFENESKKQHPRLNGLTSALRGLTAAVLDNL